MDIQERRSAKRFPLELKGSVFINGINIDLKTHDVSLGGTLVEFVTPSSLKGATKVRVRLNIGFSGRAIVCRVNTHDNCTLHGLKFDRFDFYSDLVLNAYLVQHQQHLPVASTIS
jgi:hypothetical protein